MTYSRYFKAGQKVVIKALPEESPQKRVDSLSAILSDLGAGFFDLEFPYRADAGEGFPFPPGIPFEILSEAFGLGLRLNCRLTSQSGDNSIRVEPTGDLQVFQRRLHPRIDKTLGFRYTKGRGTLKTFHEQWEKNIHILQSGQGLSKLGNFPKRLVNLSVGGLRFDIRNPVEEADICLVLLDLGEAPPPICTLAEVVWLRETETEDRFTAGMRFISILEEDQKRIERFIRNNAPPLSK